MNGSLAQTRSTGDALQQQKQTQLAELQAVRAETATLKAVLASIKEDK